MYGTSKTKLHLFLHRLCGGWWTEDQPTSKYNNNNNNNNNIGQWGRDSVADIAGVWCSTPVGRDLPDPTRPTPRPNPSPVQGVQSHCRGIKQPGCGVDPPTPSSVGSRIGTTIPLPPLCACLACNGTALPIQNSMEWQGVVYTATKHRIP
jgi:hypothetical protein